MRFTLFLSTTLVLSTAISAEHGKATCETMESCIQTLREASGSKKGVGAADRALVEQLRTFGPQVVPLLVEMLSDPNESAAELAGYALRDTKHIDVRFLPQIKAGLDRGLGWLAPALCRMDDSDAAREAVDRFIRSRSAPHNQEAYALKLCADRAIPHMVEAARCSTACEQSIHYNLGYVLGGMGPERVTAAPGLLEIAADSSAPPFAKTGALHMIGTLGDIAIHLGPELLNMRERQPELARAVDAALVGIGSRASGQVFIDRLAVAPHPVVLRDLAETGPAGMAAGPAVVKLIDSADWDLRLAAARALGFIGYADAMQPLIRLLDDKSDVRLNWVAVESLGRLHAQGALPNLRVIAQAHWYPPVRKAAETAISNIETNAPYRSRFHDSNFAFEFFEYQHFGKSQPTCRKPLLSMASESGSRKLNRAESPASLEKLTFATHVISYGPGVERGEKDDGENGVIEPTADSIVEHRVPTRQVPDVALRVENGWLAGSNRGEWGGELVFVSDDGSTKILLNENVENIHEIRGQVVALTGLAHLSSNRGVVHALYRDESGDWSTRPWRALPGAPSASWLVETGELLINVSNGGSLLLAQDGAFRIAPCADR